jgi:hypothetical protein
MLIDLIESTLIDPIPYPGRCAIRYCSRRGAHCGVFSIEFGSKKPEPLAAEADSFETRLGGYHEAIAVIDKPFLTDKLDSHYYYATTLVRQEIPSYFCPVTYSVHFRGYKDNQDKQHWEATVSIGSKILFAVVIPVK